MTTPQKCTFASEYTYNWWLTILRIVIVFTHTAKKSKDWSFWALKKYIINALQLLDIFGGSYGI